ncbi:hypothetical protein Tco_0435205 [Tanacetum coccineum]
MLRPICSGNLGSLLLEMENPWSVNDIRAERIAKSANPLALLAVAQPYSDNYYQAPKPQRTNATSYSTKPMHLPDTKAKDLPKPRDKEMQKNLALLAKLHVSQGKDEESNKLNKCSTAGAEQADWLEEMDEEIDEHNRKHITVTCKDSGRKLT